MPAYYEISHLRIPVGFAVCNTLAHTGLFFSSFMSKEAGSTSVSPRESDSGLNNSELNKGMERKKKGGGVVMSALSPKLDCQLPNPRDHIWFSYLL